MKEDGESSVEMEGGGGRLPREEGESKIFLANETSGEACNLSASRPSSLLRIDDSAREATEGLSQRVSLDQSMGKKAEKLRLT